MPTCVILGFKSQKMITLIWHETCPQIFQSRLHEINLVDRSLKFLINKLSNSHNYTLHKRGRLGKILCLN